MELAIQKSVKGKPGVLQVADSVFSAEFNEPLIHQVLSSYMAGAHFASRAQRSRSEVRGGGRKPWRQKGTGRARAGTIRSPLWRGGGVAFAAKPQERGKKVNKKMYRGAIRSIFSELVRQERFICIDVFDINEPRTRAVKSRLDGLGLEGVLIITDTLNKNLRFGARNIPKVDVIDTFEINPYSLIGAEKILATEAAVKRIEAWLS